MYLDILILVRAAEDEAHKAEILAQKKALEAIQQTESAGKEAIATTLARAESEITHLKRLSDQKATKDALELASSTANRQATLRARAERRLDTVARQIVERIKNAQATDNKEQMTDDK